MQPTAKPPRSAIILAAGKGTRMQSDLPKVLHQVGGRPMIDWSIALAEAAGCGKLVVVCSPEQETLIAHVAERLGAEAVAIQAEQLGTGDAVKAAKTAIGSTAGSTIVLYADTPLIPVGPIDEAFGMIEGGAATAVLGFEAREPGAYGRLVVDAKGALLRIVEARDCSAEELAVTTCNSGVIAADGTRLFDLVDRITNDNAKGEYYLTDIVGIAAAAGGRSGVVFCEEDQFQGVNSRDQLAEANAAFQRRKRSEIMGAGVTLEAPETVFFSFDTRVGRDAIIEPHVVFAPGVTVGARATVKSFCYLEGAELGEGVSVGPFARVRPGTKIGDGARLGNFVEVKNVEVGPGAKLNHLTYVGDGKIGAGANIGAGTIFCNYNGFEKHRTDVGEGAFIGSNSALVAPVRIGDGAYVGSGSVVTEDVPDGALAVARGRQVVRPGWAVSFAEGKRKQEKGGDG